MKYLCHALPCHDRDGSRWKMFWLLESVDTTCCQDCSGNIIPPNKEVSTSTLESNCSVFEHSVCQTNTGEGGRDFNN